MKSIIVIGGGASGLIAAIAAAREGARVTVLEAMDKPVTVRPSQYHAVF